jgi:hypothetical protein
MALYNPAIHNNWRLNLLSKIDIEDVIKLSNEIITAEHFVSDDFSRQGVIAREINATTWQSFCRFGNRKNATQGLILSWIRKDGISLDEQAMWITENYSMEVLPDELAQFIMDHDRGKAMFEPYQKLNNLYQAFHQFTGFKWTHKFVREFILIQESKKEIDSFDYNFEHFLSNQKIAS